MSAFRIAPLNLRSLRYSCLIGTGGIGSGQFFALSGDRTLGREESRGGRFLDRRDYCKLHIISHYVRTLLGPDFAAFPIGRVGRDEPGARLLGEMKAAGLKLKYVRALEGEATLFSFCFLYPDGSGGNLTTEDSACSRVDERAVAEAEPEFARNRGRGVALAVPEVPLAARAELLRLGAASGFLCAASFTSAEIQEAKRSGLLARVDLLAVNLHEAATLAGVAAERDPAFIVEAALKEVRKHQPGMQVSITAGARGSWVWDGAALGHAPAFKATVACSAGAGDAHLSGILAGLAAGLSLREAHILGALTGTVSVTSPHTIHPDLNRVTLRDFAQQRALELPDSVRALLA